MDFSVYGKKEESKMAFSEATGLALLHMGHFQASTLSSMSNGRYFPTFFSMQEFKCTILSYESSLSEPEFIVSAENCCLAAECWNTRTHCQGAFLWGYSCWDILSSFYFTHRCSQDPHAGMCIAGTKLVSAVYYGGYQVWLSCSNK
jgi:hypothetical protein